MLTTWRICWPGLGTSASLANEIPPPPSELRAGPGLPAGYPAAPLPSQMTARSIRYTHIRWREP